MKRYSKLLFCINIALIYVLLACKPKSDQPIESIAPVKPLASGTFWQLGTGRIATWTDQQLADEVGVVKRAGMDVIMVQYSALWDMQKQKYQTFIPNDAFDLLGNLGTRNPLGAIFAAAEREDVKIIIGDFLAPSDLRYEQPQKAFDYWLAPEAMNFRSTIINRYKNSPSFYGYYIANEPDQFKIKTSEDERLWIESTKKVVAAVKAIHPSLKVIHSIGLYAEWHRGGDGVLRPSAPSPEYLDDFWQPWIDEISQVDIWMMIDGIGTSLSVPRHTDIAQAWGKKMVHDAKKEFWVDVENAVMTNEFYPFTIQKLITSLNIAAKHADKIVLFEHLSYMSPNRNAASKKLYEDYIEYRIDVLEEH